MGMIHLCAAAHEADYIRRLADYVRQSAYGRSWRVSGFSSADSLAQYLAGGYPADLLLVPPDMAERARELRPGIPAALLVKHAADVREEGAVLQYQPMPRLMRRLASIMAAQGLHAGVQGDDERGENGRPAVIAVYSPSGGSGVTTTALGLAHQAGLGGTSVFCLSLEPFGVAECPGDEPGEDGLAAMLYALQSRPADEAAAVFERLRRRHPALRTDLFGGSCPPEEKLAIGAEEAGRLLEAAAGAADIGAVIVDLGAMPTEAHIEVFARSRAVFWLVPEGEAGAVKTETALGYMRRRWGGRFASAEPRIRFVAAKARGGMAVAAARTCGLQIAAALPDAPAVRGQAPAAAARRVPELQQAFARLLVIGGLRDWGGEADGAGGADLGAYGPDAARAR